MGDVIEKHGSNQGADARPAGKTGARAVRHTGGCHCGAVRFEAEIDVAAGAARCNCSACAKMATTTSIVKPSAFTLVSGEEGLGMYEWGGKTGQRYFCTKCGVHAFLRGHLAQLGGDYVSVNWNCLDDVDLSRVKVVYWDGRHDNWAAGTRDEPWPWVPAT